MPAANGHADDQLLADLVHAYPQLQAPSLEPLPGGLLHRTWAIEDPSGAFILQRVNPVFSPSIHDNIHAVTRWLADRGEATFSLEPTRDGAHAWRRGNALFRLMTRLPGETHDTCKGTAEARSAGALLARWHTALEDFDGPLADMGFPYREPERSFSALEAALAGAGEHPLRADVAGLAERIEEARARWPARVGLPARVIHGDLKFSNILFDPPPGSLVGEAFALIDLDTVCRRPLYHDLGDALRSWCNRRAEDEPTAEFDFDVFEAAAAAYMASATFALERDERESLGEAVERLAIELSARFATDALEERYFSWDAERYERAGLHQLDRARGQLDLHDQVLAHRSRIRSCFID